MSRQVPDFINPVRAAEGGFSISGLLAFGRMKRLLEVVNNPEGAAEIALDFAVDVHGAPYVRGRIRAELVVACQRCLESMKVSVDVDLSLGIVSSEDEAKRLPEHYDPLVARGEQLLVAELVEDEILLALPAIPRHDPAECTAMESEDTRSGDDGEGDEVASSPFAVLAQLKAKR